MFARKYCRLDLSAVYVEKIRSFFGFFVSFAEKNPLLISVWIFVSLANKNIRVITRIITRNNPILDFSKEMRPKIKYFLNFLGVTRASLYHIPIKDVNFKAMPMFCTFNVETVYEMESEFGIHLSKCLIKPLMILKRNFKRSIA